MYFVHLAFSVLAIYMWDLHMYYLLCRNILEIVYNVQALYYNDYYHLGPQHKQGKSK